MKKGFYIAFEGVVGTGKTTQSQKLFDFLRKVFPRREIVLTREPGGTEIAEAIRTLVQSTTFAEEMDPVCEAYLYAASRAQILRKISLPVLGRGGIVISDRCFITSLSYQGYARGLGIEKVLLINKIALEGVPLDLVIFLDLDPQLGYGRTFDKGGDKFERETIEFHKKVYRGYKKISRLAGFKDIWINLPADGSVEDIFYRVLKKIRS